MTGMARIGRLSGAALLLATLFGCGHDDCGDEPLCPVPMAVTVRVRSTAGGAVPALSLTFLGTRAGGGPCTVGETATLCYVPGTAGTYEFRLTAPGFKDETLTVRVDGTQPACGCPKVATQNVDVILTPA